MTSHAVVVARVLANRPCDGLQSSRDRLRSRGVQRQWQDVQGGGQDHHRGKQRQGGRGRAPARQPELSEDFEQILAWADELRTLGVRANADIPEDTQKAREFGAGASACAARNTCTRRTAAWWWRVCKRRLKVLSLLKRRTSTPLSRSHRRTAISASAVYSNESSLTVGAWRASLEKARLLTYPITPPKRGSPLRSRRSHPDAHFIQEPNERQSSVGRELGAADPVYFYFVHAERTGLGALLLKQSPEYA
jgi:hypothetical protein